MAKKIKLLSTPPDLLDLYDLEAIERTLDELVSRPLDDDSAVETWLADWSAFVDRMMEAGTLAQVERTRDNLDPDKKALLKQFQTAVAQTYDRAADTLNRRLISTGWSSPSMERAIQLMRIAVELFRDKNVELISKANVRANDYGETVGSLETDFDGAPRTFVVLSKLYPLNADRSMREGAWMAANQLFRDVRGPLDELFTDLVGLRTEIARNADHPDFVSYTWQDYGRLDYTRDDTLRLHAAVLTTAVPAVERRYEVRRQQLGLDVLRPWDVSVDTYGAPMKPFANGRQLLNGAVRVFSGLDRGLGNHMRFMRDNGLLDLSNRRGKNPGGYMTNLPQTRRPFIFMNAVGSPEDVQVLLHEGGHAIHTFRSAQLPLTWQRQYQIEMAEVASFSMELIAGELLRRSDGGFYDEKGYFRARIDRMQTMLGLLPWIGVIDAFQHWVYTNPVHTPAERANVWLNLHRLYMTGPDWTGLDEQRSYRWHQQLHPFEVPLYYIEYLLAWLAAVQVWLNWRRNPEEALGMWLEALSMGGTADLHTLYATAGAKLVFDEEDLRPLVDAMVEEITSCETKLFAMPA